MGGYWFRHRFVFSLTIVLALASVCVLLFIFPFISQKSQNYNDQSIYKYSDVDFVVPEPSYEQAEALQGMNGINRIFPFFLTKTSISVNGISRTTTVLLSDDFENIDITMYNEKRLIEKSNKEYENPILVDWQFCDETKAKLGDTISLQIAGRNIDFSISAIYETNALYDGGAILAYADSELSATIRENSQNNGYSGMYISSNDYNACKSYLMTDYRPLGRLRDRDSFKDDEQYQIHYDAIMSSGYANEITDFRVRESDSDTVVFSLLVWIGTAFSAASIILFNYTMNKRGAEKGFFTKHCIPKGVNVSLYYNISFVFELLAFIIAYSAIFVFRWISCNFYIPKTIIDYKIAMPIAAFIVAEIVCLIVNKSMVSGIVKRFKVEGKNKENQCGEENKDKSSYTKE